MAESCFNRLHTDQVSAEQALKKNLCAYCASRNS